MCCNSISFRSGDPDIGQCRLEQIIGRSRAVEAALAKGERVAPTDSTVLVLGEKGTRKEHQL
jgi:transcriptional regulator with GAF, ATPase, and Fis domain